jgi:hypothetical protein
VGEGGAGLMIQKMVNSETLDSGFLPDSGQVRVCLYY